MNVVRVRHRLLKSIRKFFYRHDYLEVETSNLMKTSPPDPYIDPLKVYIGERGPYYLHTSPEMGMKKLLAEGEEKIFQICKVYRIEEIEEVHSTEFTMLEWYRKGNYRDAMQEVEDLIKYIAKDIGLRKKELVRKHYTVYTVEDIVLEKTGINPFELDRNGLCEAMERKGFAGIDECDTWNDLFFKLFLQEVETVIDRKAGPYFILDWPLSISTMSKRKDDQKVERFELYIDGLEIANGYTELLNREEQRERFFHDNEVRATLHKDVFEIDESFLEALQKIQGSYAGVSLGIDRLLMVLTGIHEIDGVISNRFKG